MSVTSAEYCREIEAYLCRKNDGHLIRLVGPSFERVCGWAEKGVPLRIAYQGIDQYFVRYYAKGPRRRPVQIDFCDADVLEAFDAWRRAVGVRTPGTEPAAAEITRKQRRSLPEHLNRALERLTTILAGAEWADHPVRQVLESTADEISSLTDAGGPLRGDARSRVIARLAGLDCAMLQAVRSGADQLTLEAFQNEAAAQLAPFKDRMPPEAYDEAMSGAVNRLLRERFQLPVIAFE
jgi:hypothetical protein